MIVLQVKIGQNFRSIGRNSVLQVEISVLQVNIGRNFRFEVKKPKILTFEMEISTYFDLFSNR